LGTRKSGEPKISGPTQDSPKSAMVTYV